MAEADALIERRHIRVRGQVQGVGYRPFVYRVATELGLAGWVRNDGQGVEIEAQGRAGALDLLEMKLEMEAPPLALVDGIEASLREPNTETGFRIEQSGSGLTSTRIAPDAALCPECLEEMLDPSDRRYRYPFINCTHCGPRYTITAALPYDRPNTSMAGFTQCPACQAEYDAPADRRYHAQPNACPACGPRLHLRDADGIIQDVADPIAEAVTRLQRGEILAVKGLGGFHLMCDARNARAVATLRERKNREEKPFALMAANVQTLMPWVAAGETDLALLTGHERPVVLLRKKTGCDETFPGAAPGVAWLGAMLPYTPIQYLLFHEAAGQPGSMAWLEQPQEMVLVCTSANPGGEPLVTGNDEALERLSGIADAFLLHDREIYIRCDDSVVRMKDEGGRMNETTAAENSSFILHPSSFVFLRRARGYTPKAIKLPQSGPPVLACGGYFKNTICLTRGDEAFVSQHIGELDNAATCHALAEAVKHLCGVLEIRPECVAHDKHPEFFSTRFAAQFAADQNIPAIPVQHHHAHIAAVAAEHGLIGPLLGLALDGVGLGEDGGAWGGELLRVDGGHFERLGHLKSLALPGGDRAAREPWRMAASVLHDLGRRDEIARRFPGQAGDTVIQMLDKGLNAPPTTSAGRWFDAAAGLLGVKPAMSFEGQAAMLLEGLAEQFGPLAPMTDGFAISEAGELDLLPLMDRLAGEQHAAAGAALFHATLALALAEWVKRAVATTAIPRVALGGGCFLNAILSRSLRERLVEEGIEVFEAAQAPPNDGGLSLGQAWIALQMMRN